MIVYLKKGGVVKDLKPSGPLRPQNSWDQGFKKGSQARLQAELKNFKSSKINHSKSLQTQKNLENQKTQSKALLFANSRLGKAVENNRQVILNFTRDKVNLVHILNKKANSTRLNIDKKRSDYYKRHNFQTPQKLNEIVEKQYDLNLKGHNIAINGDYGVLTRQAENDEAAKLIKFQEEHPTLKTKILRVVNAPLHKFFQNAYGYGYDDSKTTKNTEQYLDEHLPFNKGGWHSVALGVGAASKIWKGITGTDEAGNAQREFEHLDLNTAEGKKRGLELVAIMDLAEPTYGTRRDMLSRQKSMRIRTDLNNLHTGYPQEYETFIEGDKDIEGNPTYKFKDENSNNTYRQYALRIANAEQPSTITKSNKRVYSRKGGDPYVASGGHSVISDNNGQNALYTDTWDFGVGGIDTNLLPSTHRTKILVNPIR